MIDLDAIKARYEAASPGPWKLIYEGDVVMDSDGEWVCQLMLISGDGNPTFIACAREDIPALVAEVEQLRVEVAASLEREKQLGEILSDYESRDIHQTAIMAERRIAELEHALNGALDTIATGIDRMDRTDKMDCRLAGILYILGALFCILMGASSGTVAYVLLGGAISFVLLMIACFFFLESVCEGDGLCL